MRVGVLDAQGDVYENLRAVRSALKPAGKKADVVRVSGAAVKDVDALVIPGGESTAMGRLCSGDGSLDLIRSRIESGMPVLGVCAGLVLLSKGVTDSTAGSTGQPLVGALDVDIVRNAFGRQSQSFEAAISMEEIGIKRYNGVFIRAPYVSRTGDGVKGIASLGGRVVAVKKGAILGTAFHPELSGDHSLHAHFLGLL
ncbi:MAG: pyridoxal 5'-phosphate synthase glutaminase subunit PdxT [Nitrosopumilus sp.]|nr:pyridoxal 5'-phosphate synthase glutaminase subunit PdxT [Nitrosopumilus sp.]CAI9832065.1 Pyridoxal 5'-phosphate synthase subunit PdxT [Nitrosopumilaceae archaeon]MDA7941436.1 pyridoxal 5'-phosphate synthase glutaminase subunit PdxT [Nitrosopumilus sp.]MDA7942842.1 pyridoxal 5'-phosphate synthase glutaminase subunit PdxT [Nitrosopumilus sp.]MDA7945423.1 pyridoxal 5'-phosphate synthase glutaminase subunit PdxT [Nitrosopumilus sp.]